MDAFSSLPQLRTLFGTARRLGFAALALSLVALLAPVQPAQARDAEILELLEQIKRGQLKDNKADQERIREFKRNRSEQRRLLNKEKSDNKTLQARSDKLDIDYNEGEKELQVVRAQYIDRLGSLKELFGVLQGASGDLRANLLSSLTQAESRLSQTEGNRVEFLTSFGSLMGGESLPAVEDLERLWYEYTAEIVASGEVRRFSAKVQQEDGSLSDEPVVRVGLFNAVGRSGYLTYPTDKDFFNVMQRQPAARFQETAESVATLPFEGGSVPFALDPTRGQLLGLLVDSPTIGEKVEQGGEVGYLIIFLGLVALFLSIYRYVALSGYRKAINKQRKNLDKPDPKNPLGYVLAIYNKNRNQDLETLELKLDEAILAQTPKFTRNLAFIKIIAVVAPLMGLLGTVTGMIITFQSITQFGAGDPKLMAGGISQALVTTVLGLVVAIPTVFLHSILSAQAKGITQFLEERVTALVADFAATTGKPAAPPPRPAGPAPAAPTA